VVSMPWHQSTGAGRLPTGVGRLSVDAGRLSSGAGRLSVGAGQQVSGGGRLKFRAAAIGLGLGGLILGGGLAPMSDAAAQVDTVHVDCGAGDDGASGALDEPVRTISQALAMPAQTISIAAGTCEITEPLSITQGVTIEGAGSGDGGTVVRGVGSVFEDAGEENEGESEMIGGFVVDAGSFPSDDVLSVSGLHITEVPVGLRQDKGNLEIADVHVSKATRDGLRATLIEGARADIADINLTDVRRGIMAAVNYDTPHGAIKMSGIEATNVGEIGLWVGYPESPTFECGEDQRCGIDLEITGAKISGAGAAMGLSSSMTKWDKPTWRTSMWRAPQ